MERVTAVFPFSGHLCLLFLCRNDDRQIFHADGRDQSLLDMVREDQGDIGAKFSRKFSGAEEKNQGNTLLFEIVNVTMMKAESFTRVPEIKKCLSFSEKFPVKDRHSYMVT